MKTSLESLSALQRKLNIEVPATEVQAAFHRAYDGIKRNVTVKGFRKGKAPLAQIKMIYGDRVKQDVIQDIIQNHYAVALREHSLDPISYPTIEFDPMEDEQRDFAFTAEFEVRPEVKLTKVEGLKVKKEKFEMREELVDATLEDIRKRQATMVPVLENRPAQMSDTAVVDFKGFVDGQPLENGAGENHPLELGSNSFIPGFEEGIVGMSVGATKRIQLKFPDEYHAKDIAGKQVEFEVTVKELKKKSLPEATDEFVKGLGPYESVAALRTVIREDFEKRETKRVNDDMRNRLMKALVDANPVEVPQSLLKDQKKTLIEDFEKRMSQQNMSPAEFEDYKQKWDGDFTETASYMIQSSFLIDKIAGDQNLRATPADVEAKLQEYAQQTGLELAQIKEFYNDDDRRSRIAYQCTEEKVLTYLMSKATVVEVSKEDLAKEDVRGN